MLVQCIEQCDVMLPGRGHPAERKRALFPGIVYDLPEEAVERLVQSGQVRIKTVQPEAPSPADTVHVRSKPRGGKS